MAWSAVFAGRVRAQCRRLLAAHLPALLKVADVFIALGQSNMHGFGTGSGYTAASGKAFSIASNTGAAYGTLSRGAGGFASMSPWPRFGDRWFDETGRMAAFVPATVSGSGMLAATAAGPGTWEVTGSGLWDVTYGPRAVAAIALLDTFPRFTRGTTYVLFGQGETDADSINGSTVTAALYQTAANALFDAIEADIGPCQFCIFELGLRHDGAGGIASEANWDAVRAAQGALVAARPDTMFAMQAADSLAALSQTGFVWASGWEYVDTANGQVHYSENAYNTMGVTGAVNIGFATA